MKSINIEKIVCEPSDFENLDERKEWSESIYWLGLDNWLNA